MLLPTADCPRCQQVVLVYRVNEAGTNPLEASLETRCLDCDLKLDRFDEAPSITDRPLTELTDLGYTDLDRPRPVGLGGCFETRGCAGCPKIDTRPW